MQATEPHRLWIKQYKQQKEGGCKIRVEYVVYTLCIYNCKAHNNKDIEQSPQNPAHPQIAAYDGHVKKTAEQGNPILLPIRCRDKEGGYCQPHQQGGKYPCPE